MELHSSSEKISNLSHFASLVGGNKQIVLEVIDTFLKQSVEEWKLLDEAMDAGELERVSKIAHGMKSTVAVVGASVIPPILENIQHSAKPGAAIAPIQESVQTLKTYYDQCIEEIKSERKDYI